MNVGTATKTTRSLALMATELVGRTGRATKQYLYLGAQSEAISDMTETQAEINFEFTKKQNNSEHGSDQRKNNFQLNGKITPIQATKRILNQQTKYTELSERNKFLTAFPKKETQVSFPCRQSHAQMPVFLSLKVQ